MTAIVWLAPEWWPVLLALPPLLLLAAFWSARAERRRRRLLGSRVAGPRRPGRVAARAACTGTAALAAGLALLQPAWGIGEQAPAGPDVVLCLDLSRSMAARDRPPSRLAAAQQQIERLAAQAVGSRLGLVVFAGDARLVVPLTADAAAVAAVANVQAPGTSGRGGTDLGAAIDVAAGTLRRAGSASGSIVVLSDGEDFAGGGVAAAARALAAGFVVHCLGFGTGAGSRIVVESDAGEQFLRDAAGDEVVTRLDLEGLAAIAAAGGGRAEAVRDDAALPRLHRTELEPRAFTAAVRSGAVVPAARYQWFLLAACVCWMLRRWWSR